MPLVARNLTDIVMATRGRLIKCVVVDLDNTLWGGVIGDDGVDGIQLSAHGDGEAFHRMQHFLRDLSSAASSWLFAARTICTTLCCRLKSIPRRSCGATISPPLSPTGATKRKISGRFARP